MASNKKLLELKYKAVQKDYEELRKIKKGTNKQKEIYKLLQFKYFLTERALDYIIYREYENKRTAKREPNQRVTTEGNKNVKTKKQGINQNVKTCV